jgi:hypothetical protein
MKDSFEIILGSLEKTIPIEKPMAHLRPVIIRILEGGDQFSGGRRL